MGRTRQDSHGTPFDRWQNEGHKIDCKPGWDILPTIVALLDVQMDYRGPKQVTAEVAEQHTAFAGATYEAMDLLGVRLSEIGETV